MADKTLNPQSPTRQRRCIGQTKRFRRCRRQVDGWFCDDHRYQPAVFAFVFAIGYLADVGGLYQDVVKPLFIGEERHLLEFSERNDLESYREVVTLRDGAYEVTDTIGFDEPVKHSEIEITRSPGGVYILLEVFANSGYYKYEVEGKDRGNIIVGELISTNDGTIHANDVAVLIKTRTNGDAILAEVQAKALDVRLLLILRPKSV